MAKMLYSIRWDGEAPTLDQVRKRYGLGGDDVDEEFGVVATDPDESLYSILIEESAVERVRGEGTEEAAELEGPYANPRIEPFDLQEPGER